MNIEDYREIITTCTTCKGCVGIINTPRYGTGCRIDAELMIIAQNPPHGAVHHGAYMLHYKDAPLGVHEKLVYELVSRLQLTNRQVFATQTTKCPTIANATPPLYVATACGRSYLEQEIRDCNPKVILCMGQQAERVVSTMLRWGLGEKPEGYHQSYSVVTQGDTPSKLIRRSGSVISIPHPSTVGRFVNKESWLSQVKLAHNDGLAYARPKVTIE